MQIRNISMSSFAKKKIVASMNRAIAHENPWCAAACIHQYSNPQNLEQEREKIEVEENFTGKNKVKSKQTSFESLKNKVEDKDEKFRKQ